MVASQVKFMTTFVGLETSTHTCLSLARRVPSCAHVCGHTQSMHTHPCTHTSVHTGRRVGQTGPHQKPLSGGQVQGRAPRKPTWLPWWSAVPSGAGDRLRPCVLKESLCVPFL